MAKINNLTKNFLPFGSSALPADRNAFGTGVNSDTLDDNINNDYFGGWRAVSNENDPPQMHDMNGAMYAHSAMLQYFKQHGISEWVSTQEMYYPCLVFGSNKDVYAGVFDGFDYTVDPVTDDGTNWIKVLKIGGQGIAGYSRIYTATGANTIALTAISQQENPSAYYNSMIVEFIAVANNTGNVILYINGLGSRQLRNQDGTQLSAGTIVAGELVKAFYDGIYFRYYSVSKGGFGVNTAYYSVTRQTGVTYTNTTNEPIFIFIRKSNTVTMGIQVNGSTIGNDQTSNSVSFIVPPGATYRYTGSYVSFNILKSIF